jgi:hypothetical protein
MARMSNSLVIHNFRASLANFRKGFFTYEISPLPLLKKMAHPGNTIQVLPPELQEKYIKTNDVDF